MAFKSFLFNIIILFVLALVTLCGANANIILYSGETLYAGQRLTNAQYELVCQADCNVVLYQTGQGPVWASNTGGIARNCHCTMQSDGNFVAYAPDGRAIWASNTYQGGHANYVLVLQKDRNLVIYGPALWATHTNSGTQGVRIVRHSLNNITPADDQPTRTSTGVPLPKNINGKN